MTKKDKQVKFKVGDRVIELNTNEKGTITRLCSDKDVICVRWGKDSSQQMVETKNLEKR